VEWAVCTLHFWIITFVANAWRLANHVMVRRTFYNHHYLNDEQKPEYDNHCEEI